MVKQLFDLFPPLDKSDSAQKKDLARSKGESQILRAVFFIILSNVASKRDSPIIKYMLENKEKLRLLRPLVSF